MRNVMTEPAVGDRLADEFGYRWKIAAIENDLHGRPLWICVEQIDGDRPRETWWMRQRDFVAGFKDARRIGRELQAA